VRRVLALVLVPLALATALALVVLWPEGPDRSGPRSGTGFDIDTVEGTVQRLDRVSCSGGEPAAGDPAADPTAEPTPGPADGPEVEAGDGTRATAAATTCYTAFVRLERGPAQGQTVPVDVVSAPNTLRVEQGSGVVLAFQPRAPADQAYQLVDVQRDVPLLLLAAVAAAAVVLLARWRGLAALAGLGASLLLLGTFVLPALLQGRSPLLVAVVGAAAILLITLYATHGFTVQTSIAVAGTLASLALTGLLAAVFVPSAVLTGAGGEGSGVLAGTYAGLDLRGLLLAGIVIGALGVLDDVTTTQASAVWELRRADPGLGVGPLYRAGLRIGRTHIASTVNTLVLAYAGASLPLLLLFTVADRAFADIVTNELVAQEIVRTLVGSIGLAAAVPLTTLLAAAVAVLEPAGRPGGTGTGGTGTGEGRRPRHRR